MCARRLRLAEPLPATVLGLCLERGDLIRDGSAEPENDVDAPMRSAGIAAAALRLLADDVRLRREHRLRLGESCRLDAAGVCLPNADQEQRRGANGEDDRHRLAP